MKKTYISPEVLTVQVGTMHMIAESLFVDYAAGTDKKVTGTSGGWAKENKAYNVWDEEW